MINSRNYAVEFGKSVDKGIGPNKAYPFWYTLIPKADDTWEADKGTLAGNIGFIGPTIPAQGEKDWSINLSADYNFMLLRVHYTVYYIDSGNSNYEWYDDETGWRYDYGSDQSAVGTPLTRFIGLSLAYRPASRYLYGESSIIPLTVVQGNESGIGELRTKVLLPRSGQLIFHIENDHTTKDLVVGASVFGIKVRL